LTQCHTGVGETDTDDEGQQHPGDHRADGYSPQPTAG